MGDIVEFDKAGKGGTSSAGALIHEHVEQLEKSKMGLSKGDLGKTKPDPSVVGGKNMSILRKRIIKLLRLKIK